MIFTDYNNPQVAMLPRHLKRLVVDQDYERYTPVDHAVWRYVMRQNYSYLKGIAYYPYIPGLKKAGLTTEKIPHLQDMNDALGRIGWGAVTVNGFIPPAAFMEFQSFRVLVVAADIRQLKHIEYTPAPDIIHESAGHAPIIADEDYHRYLSLFGSIGAKAIYSAKDFELYEAIRQLSILKEMPEAPPIDLQKAENRVQWCTDHLGDPSEMALLSRLHWWTVEYGLIGTPKNPKIYGAGLLSSIGESANCMRLEVKKLPYNLETINYAYDITQPQPQLFVTPNFQNLFRVLEAFADTMSFRTGGANGLMQAIACKNTCTAVYSSGLQVSGTFTDAGLTSDHELYFIKTTGPTALAIAEVQLETHDKSYHKDGFSSPVGKINGVEKALEYCSLEELKSIGIAIGETPTLAFESGITVIGKVKSITVKGEKTVLVSFEDCHVKDAGGNILFKPAWGIYDMAVGEKIVSVFCGAADKDKFDQNVYKSETALQIPFYDKRTVQLHALYQTVRNCREQSAGYEHLESTWQSIRQNHSDDWLCSMEILEILEQEKLLPETAMDIRIFLKMKSSNEPALIKLISDGFYLIKHPVEQKSVSV
ncbi:MAG: aromatic amino acid hydroxylase [Sphingobacteriaceae bacterium]